MRTLVTVLAMLWCWCGLAQMPPRVMQDMQEAYASIPSAAPSGYSPTNVAGYNVAAWYRASDVTTNGATYEMADLTGKGQKMVQATESKFPVGNPTGLNSLPTISFNGGQGIKVTSAVATNNPYQVVMVMRSHDSGNGDFQYWFGDGSATRPMVGFYVTSENVVLDLDAITSITASLFTNKWMVYDFVWYETNQIMFTNSVQVCATTLASRVLTGWALGERAATTRYSKFDLSELLIYAGSGLPYTNATAWADLHTYLNNRYNLTP